MTIATKPAKCCSKSCGTSRRIFASGGQTAMAAGLGPSKGCDLVPYHLPELLAEPTRTVVVVEGERDVETPGPAWRHWRRATRAGRGKWTAEHSAFLRGRRVVVLPDNDDTGRSHAQRVAQSLHGIAESVRIVELPGLPDKGDVSDWIAAGGTSAELKRLAEAAPGWTPTAVVELAPILTCLADVEARPVSWLWEGRIPLGALPSWSAGPARASRS